ncbi:formyltransferase family protein (plasmid) [Embleya sp. NBC_00888]|uniref:formyltransferase family protein n=1 Tax=Embleya sp. NBC_00888 TaxID=2975960 RepID=UPI002F909B22|nr:formyltransferase family protein [Embleya sp. NBC_00888]
MSEPLRLALLSSTAAGLTSMRTACDRTRHRTVVHATPAVLWHNGTREDDTDARLTAIRASAPPATAVVAGRVGELADLLRPHAPDVLIVYGYAAMLPSVVLDVARLGAINLHSGDLPRLRGPAPVAWALRRGDPYIGLTAHRMRPDSYDSGPILAQSHLAAPPDGFDPDAFHDSVVGRLMGLLPTALHAAERGWPGRCQEHEHATEAPFVTAAARVLDLGCTAEENRHLVRALRYIGWRPLLCLDNLWYEIAPHSGLTRTPECPEHVECADRPLWVGRLTPVDPPLSTGTAAVSGVSPSSGTGS